MSSPLLLTPGPLTTSEAVRAALAHDHGARDPAFIALSDTVRADVAGLVGPLSEVVCVPIQGSGTYAMEATLGTLVPRHGKVLVLVNGAYGRRMVEICHTIGRNVTWLETPVTEPYDLRTLERTLANDDDITHVAAVYCETTTGMLNPVHAVARVVRAARRGLLLDAMSAFGALPLSLEDLPFDAVVACANKCLESVPGVAFSVVRREVLASCQGNAHSLALDLHAQQRRFDKDGQWRFTAPTQVIAALHAALLAHADEGGVAGRGARYAANARALVDGMRALGFRTLLPDALQSPIVVTFLQPTSPLFGFEAFYDALAARGFLIYPGKVTAVDTFRVGCIGQVFPEDVGRFVAAVREVMGEMGLGAA